MLFVSRSPGLWHSQTASLHLQSLLHLSCLSKVQRKPTAFQYAYWLNSPCAVTVLYCPWSSVSVREKHTISSSFTTIGPWYQGSQSYTMIFELVHWVLVLTVDGHPGVCDHEVQPVISPVMRATGWRFVLTPVMAPLPVLLRVFLGTVFCRPGAPTGQRTFF